MDPLDLLFKVISSNATYNVVAILALGISSYVAYRTLMARFKAKIWPVNAVVLMYVEDIPSIGLGYFLENTGAKAGRLDDIRLIVKHSATASSYNFYPHLIRDDYNIFAAYEAKDWFPFSGMNLLPGDKMEKFIVFKPLNDRFSAEVGEYNFLLQVRWNGSKD